MAQRGIDSCHRVRYNEVVVMTDHADKTEEKIMGNQAPYPAAPTTHDLEKVQEGDLVPTVLGYKRVAEVVDFMKMDVFREKVVLQVRVHLGGGAKMSHTYVTGRPVEDLNGEVLEWMTT